MLGNRIGDRILVEVADRLVEATAPDGIVGLSGGQFVMLVPGALGPSETDCLLARIHTVIAEPFVANGDTIELSACLGVAHATTATPDVEAFLADGEVALEQAISLGPARDTIFEPAFRRHAVRQIETQHDLSRAVSDNELRLAFQPIVELGDDTVIGYEALVRWQHPNRGLLAPKDFLGIAQRTGAGAAIDDWVLIEACQRGAGGEALGSTSTICVNVAPERFSMGGFVDRVEAALATTGLDPARLVIEITEWSVLVDVAAAPRHAQRAQRARSPRRARRLRHRLLVAGRRRGTRGRRDQDRRDLRGRPWFGPGPDRDRARHRRARPRARHLSRRRGRRDRGTSGLTPRARLRVRPGVSFRAAGAISNNACGEIMTTQLEISFVRGLDASINLVPAPIPTLRLSVLGSFQFCAGGTTPPLPSGSQRLLALLALRDRSVTRLMIAGILWPDSSEQHASASLRSALTRLRGDARSAVEVADLDLSLARDVVVDIRESKRLAHRLLDSDPPHLTSREVAAAVVSLSADLLPDWYEEWVLIETAEWRQLRLHALEALADNLTAEGRWAEAISAAQAAIRGEPLRETSHAALIRVFLAEGNQTEALGQFERYRALLHNELSLDPTPNIANLVSSIGRRRTDRRLTDHAVRERSVPSLTDEDAFQLGADLEEDLAHPRLGDPERGADLVHLHTGHALRDDPPSALRHSLRRVRERVGRLDLGERGIALADRSRAGGRARPRR